MAKARAALESQVALDRIGFGAAADRIEVVGQLRQLRVPVRPFAPETRLAPLRVIADGRRSIPTMAPWITTARAAVIRAARSCDPLGLVQLQQDPISVKDIGAKRGVRRTRAH